MQKESWNIHLTKILICSQTLIVVNERNIRSVDQRENLQIQKENTGKENRMLNWVRAGYGWETSVIVGMSSDQFYDWKPTLKWRKFFWTGNSGKCNVYILTMKINRTLWLIEVMNLFGEHTLFYTNLGLFHNNTPPPSSMFPTKVVRILCLIKIHKN
jgi:hypothetical protein